MRTGKTVAASLIVVALFAFGGIAYAQWGMHGTGGYYGQTNVENLKKFQSETLNLRDALETKQIELDNEYAKPAPDTATINTLQADIADLNAKINAVAAKYGISNGNYYGGYNCNTANCPAMHQGAQGGYMMGHGMGYGMRGGYGMGCW